MAYPTASSVLYGNPPATGHTPSKADFRVYLEGLETVATVESVKGIHGAVGDLPSGGNTLDDHRIVVAGPDDGGGVYKWDGLGWVLVAALPSIFTTDEYALLAQAWAESATAPDPADPTSKSAKTWAGIATDKAAEASADRAGAEAAESGAETARDQAALYVTFNGLPPLDTLPALPDPSYPIGAKITLLSDAGLQAYENEADVWEPKTWISYPHFRARNVESATKAKALGDGAIVYIDGLLYEVDSNVTTLSATADLGVEGLKPAYDATWAHFGADNTGAVDSTASLKRMVTWALENKRWHDWGDGTYKVSGPLFTNFTTAEGAFLMRGGAVKINVDAAATAFEYLFYTQITAIADKIIDVAFLIVDCAEKAGSAFWLRHSGGVGGVAVNRGLIWIKNVLQTDVSISRENGGLCFFGAFSFVDFGRGIVENVGRVAGANLAGTATFGLSASGFEDIAPISGWVIDTVHCGSAANSDADGIKLFGRNPGTEYNARSGHAIIRDCKFRNCMGRGVKFQTQGTVANCEFVLHDTEVIANGLHIDFQVGAGRATGCRFVHKQDGGTNPFSTGTSFSMIGCQLTVDNRELAHVIADCELVFDVACPRMIAVIPRARQRDSSIDVRGLRLLPVEGAVGGAFLRAGAEVLMTDVFAASPNTTRISVSGVVGPIGAPLIGHTGFSQSAGATVTGATQANPCVITAVGHGFHDGARVTFSGVGGMTELNGTHPIISVLTDDTFELVDVDSTGYAAFTSGGTATFSNEVFFFEAFDNDDTLRTNKRPIYAVSSDPLIDMTRLRIRNNDGYQNLYNIAVFDIDALPAGTEFTLLYGTGNVTDAPATWNAGGQTWDFGVVKTGPGFLGDGYVECRFTILDSNTVPMFFEKYTNGASWTEYRGIKQQAAYSNIGTAPTQADFNYLLARLRDARVIAP